MDLVHGSYLVLLIVVQIVNIEFDDPFGSLIKHIIGTIKIRFAIIKVVMAMSHPTNSPIKII